MQKYRIPSSSTSLLIRVALLHAALVKNIAISFHYLNQEAYTASIETKERWKYCSHFDTFISFGML